MLTIVTWKWGKKYSADYVLRLEAGVSRWLWQKHRFICITDDDRGLHGIETLPIVDPDLCDRGCFCRLRLFDPDWQKQYGLDDRIVCLDLDAIVTGNLDPLFDRSGLFVVLQGVNAVNPCPYNCSVFMLKAEAYPEIWSKFDPKVVSHVPYHEFPDDQGWLHHMIPQAAGWSTHDGIYAFRKPGWPKGEALPPNARLVVFPGRQDPSHYLHLPWIKRNWE